MRFLSRNKNLLIELVEEKNETGSGLLLPEDYKKPETGLKVAKLLNAEIGSFHEDIGKYLLFESHLMQSFIYMGKTYTFIPSTAVHGVFEE